MKRFLVLLILITISLFSSNGKGTPRVVQYNILDETATMYDWRIETDNVFFNAWIRERPSEIIDENSSGSYFVMAPNDSTPLFSTIIINLGDFSIWQEGEELWIDIYEDVYGGGKRCGYNYFTIPEGSEAIGIGFEPYIADTGQPIILSSMYCSSIDQNGYTPESTKLKQNYPNPFNPTTTIEFDIEKQGMVSLNIYNQEGKIVRNAVDNFMNAGKHSVDVDLSGFSSGSYYYILQVDGVTEAKKMVLVK